MIINNIPQNGFGATFERTNNMTRKQKELFYYINRFMDEDTEKKLSCTLPSDVIILAKPCGKDKVSLQALGFNLKDDDDNFKYYNFANGEKYSTGGFASKETIMNGFKKFIDKLVNSICDEDVVYEDKFLVKKQPDVVYLPMH